LYFALESLKDPALPAPLETAAAIGADPAIQGVRAAYNAALADLGADAVSTLKAWPTRTAEVTAPEYSYPVRGREVRGANYSESLSHNSIPKLAPPRLTGWGDTLRFLQNENLPGAYPFTGGVYPYRREEEDPTRMFAGEGAPERTNRRFHYLAGGHEATRLSTAFDSTTLYGEDPDLRPDIFGRTGNSGVSIATLDDMKKLYSGFDLCKPSTSVSMTINGPAPMILAMFMNTAIDQRVEAWLRESGGWAAAKTALARDPGRPRYREDLPPGHDASGLGLLGASGRELVELGVLPAAEYARLRAEALSRVRGTVQADILKEDQAQNTCIFSTEFALRMMGDVQEFFSANAVKNFYSVSISGYHIAEAGANPVTQLAFTLANGFTIVEYYLARGMKIDDFAPNLSFFFSNGMDAEYVVIGRVARRIWARAMKDIYAAGPRSQMLKYHIQTSGRSLHAREIQFNDIRTTLQAMYALFDNCNSLHTNAYDEALTTPSEESVRRAVAIQLIINRELGLNKIQNPWQGSYAIEQLTDLVEEAVYKEFDSIAERGGVLGAMETMYQRGKIQEESMHYEMRKHDGSLPIVGVNTYLAEQGGESSTAPLFRASDEEQRAQVDAVHAFQKRHETESVAALSKLQAVAAAGGNVFEELLETVRVCSLGQITRSLYSVGGQYRRHM
jgi:methylmalonyl-CoA mutase